ncbi:4-hydroxy-tetrahydrodipicolinate reductase [Holospora obtusa F1]|uniref:4-hydroxy-tetrahydrodipicolinate reductase n=1 Tax=Holospora obtusa F1 TaxID=1399147 RepID=W6TF42_HOLOB|nr:dihydrodipicolinate reductase C-terminal domain-containing protein [Holospora obtusa]ETZ07576.1 4-hydroxy-tetrahydrodipicolinate reductase [Holospora obtusa F1]
MRLGVFGGLGRLGTKIVDLAKNYNNIDEIYVMDLKQKEQSIKIFKDFILKCDGIIDVSGAQGTKCLLDTFLDYGSQCDPKLLKKFLVIGSTGHTLGVQEMVSNIIGFCSVLYAPNASLSLWNFLRSIVLLAQTLGPDWDVHVHDHHHKFKKDAPSGTALYFIQHLESACPWLKQKIQWSSIRGGIGVILNSVIFSGNCEVIQCTHQVMDTYVFAKGLLDMALWIQNCEAGYYDVQQYLLSLKVNFA